MAGHEADGTAAYPMREGAQRKARRRAVKANVFVRLSKGPDMP